jgi:hypothetical protein
MANGDATPKQSNTSQATIGPDTTPSVGSQVAQAVENAPDIPGAGVYAGLSALATSSYDWLKKQAGYTPAGGAENPVKSAIGKLGQNATELIVGGQEAGKPLGTKYGVANNPVTVAMSFADAPESAAKLENLVREYGPQFGQHLLETGQNFSAAAREAIERGLAATTPADREAEAGAVRVPAIDFSEIGGKAHETGTLGGGFSGALNEGSKAANTPEWVAGEYSHEINRLEGVLRNPDATAEDKAIASNMLQSTREQVEHGVNAAVQNRIESSAKQAGLQYKGSLPGKNGEVYHTFDDPARPGDQINVKQSELPAENVGQFLQDKMAAKRAEKGSTGETVEQMRQRILAEHGIKPTAEKRAPIASKGLSRAGKSQLKT